jgi:energy-coupling factor transport system permease protein
MQDMRIRVGAGVLLSLAAFISIDGAAAALIWWLVFAGKMKIIRQIKLVLSLILLILFFSALLALMGGDGLSYFVRMSVILLIGMWVFTERQPGEFLDFGVWLFGDRYGFELGMLGEMGMQSLTMFESDFDRICIAERLKGNQLGIRSIVPAGLILVHGGLERAEETAGLLAVRGFCNGGTRCPEFVTGRQDIVGGLLAIAIGIFAVVPLSEFFILYR